MYYAVSRLFHCMSNLCTVKSTNVAIINFQYQFTCDLGHFGDVSFQSISFADSVVCYRDCTLLYLDPNYMYVAGPVTTDIC